jgi:hypothetical protein
MMETEQPRVEEIELPTRVPGNIPQFPNLEEYMLEDANYPDLHAPPPEIPAMKRYPPRKIETEVFKVSEQPKPAPFVEINQEIQTAIDNLQPVQPKVDTKPSLLSRLLSDFNIWRKNRPKKRYIEVRTESDLTKLFHGIRNENADQLPFSPTYILDKKTQLSQLISMFAPTDVLIRAGFRDLNAEQLAEHGLVISNLRCYQRSPADIAKLYTTFEYFLAAGFNRLHFDSRLWTLEAFAAAFKMSPTFMAKLCGLGVRDLLYAGVTPANLPFYDITAKTIRDDPYNQPYEIYFAINMNPFELRKLFQFQVSDLFKDGIPVMNNAQICILLHRCRWTKENLIRVGATKADLIGLGIPVKK